MKSLIRNWNLLKLAAAMMLLVAAVPLFGQGGMTVRGRVTDIDGEPLFAASVEVKGSKTGVITDENGEYVIDVPSPDSRLVFSYIGMIPVEIALKGRAIADAVLRPDLKLLDEVVVIGYGEVKRSDLTGSVSTVSSKSLSDRVVTSLEDAMRGKAAGVSIMQDDGTPGSSFSIKIRGASSVNASSTPIYVIDGIICDDAEDISVGDVESIEIMKDASSTAIYGSRGANGVIIITTKRGKEGRVNVNFQANVGVQLAVRPYDMMDSREYAEMKYKSQWQYASFENATMDWLNQDSYYYFRDSQAPDANWWRISKDAQYADYYKYSSPDISWCSAAMRNIPEGSITKTSSATNSS